MPNSAIQSENLWTANVEAISPANAPLIAYKTLDDEISALTARVNYLRSPESVRAAKRLDNTDTPEILEQKIAFLRNILTDISHQNYLSAKALFTNRAKQAQTEERRLKTEFERLKEDPVYRTLDEARTRLLQIFNNTTPENKPGLSLAMQEIFTQMRTATAAGNAEHGISHSRQERLKYTNLAKKLP